MKQMDDLISRQQAIDALDKRFDDVPMELTAEILRLRRDLRELPSSVQPEIIRCKDCDWWTKQQDSLQGRCALFGMYPTGAWYCANARERGEADGTD